MPASRTAKSAKPPAKRNRKHAPKQDTGIAAADDLSGLKNLREDEVSKYTSVKNTDNVYNGHRSRGRGFLKDLVSKRIQAEADGTSLPDSESDGIVTEVLAQAFDDGPPNEYSALALEMFIVHKCFNEGCGKDTAEGIHGAFAALWDNIDGGRYGGEYEFDESTREVKGNPARASSVRSVIKSVKTRGKTKGDSATRSHAEAMSFEELKKIMQWSEQECPSEWLEGKDISEMSIETLRKCLTHGFMRAFLTSGFILWTRCFELLSLQASDLQENCNGPPPFFLHHFKVELLNQKGWQNEKGYDGPRQANVYNIYPQNVAEMDMYTHLLRWKGFLETVVQRKLMGDDYLFPHFGTNGIVRLDRKMSYDSLMAMLTDICSRAGVNKRYTTHSLRRGGAQFRFMYAPIGQRWSLNRVRWWGGWAVGEHCDTLIKYLVDSLQSLENSHGDALNPCGTDASEFFMGEHRTAELRAIGEEITRNVVEALQPQIISQPSQINASYMAAEAARVVLQELATRTQAPMPAFNFGTVGITSSAALPAAASYAVSAPAASGPIAPALGYGPLQASPATIAVVDSAPFAAQCGGFASSNMTSGVPNEGIAPLANVSIPELGRKPGAWLRALQQWYEVDPVTGCALKDWPPSWYSGPVMRTKMGSLYRQRQIIAQEYERLGNTAENFLREYPDANRSISKLLDTIRRNTNCVRRSSKNGTPEFRATRSVSVTDDY